MKFKNAREIIKKTKKGEIKPSKVANEYLEKIKQLDPKINAFITINEKAPKQAKEIQKTNKENKPLQGLPIAVKDNEETKKMKTTYGSKFYKNHQPKQNSTLIKRLKKAGATIIGKTNLPEFGLIAYTDNLITGTTKNPWNLNKTVGGSSGGSAAAVASGMAPVATGSDSGGSIRIPASFCGLYGLKPSFGRIPAYPSKPVFSGLHSKGFITRDVEDTALLLDVTAGRDSKDMDSLPKEEVSYFDSVKNIEEENSFDDVNIAFSPDLGYAVVEPEVKKIVRNAAYELEEFGQVEEVEIEAPNLEEELTKKMSSELVSMLGEDLEDWKEVAFPPFVGFISIGESVITKEYIKIEERKKDLWTSLRPIFEEYDFLITPTVSVPPFEIGEMGVDEIAGEDMSPLGWMPFTYPFNFTSQPAASIPAGFTKNDLPVGMQIVGKHFDDLGVLKISKKYQNVNPWQDKTPNLSSVNNQN